MAGFMIKANDLEPSIQTTLTESIDGGPATPVNLTGRTVSFIMRLPGAAVTKVNAAAAIVDAAAGVVRYDWIAGDTDTPGEYQAEWESVSGGRPRTFPTDAYDQVTIYADLDGAA